MPTTNKPLPRKQRVLNRGYLYTRTDDDIKNPSVTLMDIDSAIMFYIENVIKPSVEDNGENIKVPIMYSSPERWKAIQRDGFMRDKKRQVITPVITYRRTSIEKDDMVPQDKLDANDPHLFYTFEKKFSDLNRYDNFSTQIGLLPQREYYNVAFPDYVTLNYDFIIWTTYIEQMNKIVERVVYSDGAYWGDPDKLRFRTRIDSFTDATEVSDVKFYLTDKQDFVMAKPSDTESLISALEYLIKNPDKRSEIGHNGYNKCKLYFNPQNNGQSLMELLEKV